MPIRKHGKGWEVRVQSAGRRFSRTVATREDAVYLERQVKRRISDSRAGRLPAYSLEEALARWLSGEAKSLKSYRNLRNKVRAIYPHAKGKDLEAVVDVAESVKRDGVAASLKPATINRRLAILRRVAKLAFRQWGWISVDLGARITLVPGEEPRRVQASPAQVRTLLMACEPALRLAVLWASLTGLRKGELIRVRPEHFKGRSLLVERTKTGKPRMVPLAPELKPAEFPSGLTEDMLAKGFRRARERAGMPWLQFRDLRRTFGSWIVQKTKSLKLAQDLLGHTTPTITSRHYAHLLNENLREAVRQLPRLAGLAQGRKKR